MKPSFSKNGGGVDASSGASLLQSPRHGLQITVSVDSTTCLPPVPLDSSLSVLCLLCPSLPEPLGPLPAFSAHCWSEEGYFI